MDTLYEFPTYEPGNPMELDLYPDPRLRYYQKTREDPCRLITVVNKDVLSRSKY